LGPEERAIEGDQDRAVGSEDRLLGPVRPDAGELGLVELAHPFAREGQQLGVLSGYQRPDEVDFLLGGRGQDESHPARLSPAMTTLERGKLGHHGQGTVENPGTLNEGRPMDSYVIGVDIGTTATKAVLLDGEERIVAESTRVEHGTVYPPEQPSGAEQDPEDWWAGTVKSVRQVLAASAIEPRRVAAIAVSSQAPCVVLVDRDGRPVRPALLWMDRRSDEECRLRSPVGEEIRRLCGNAVDPYYAAPKMAWLITHEPRVKARTRRFLTANGYVNFRLTGTYTVDNGHAGLTLLAGLNEVRWSPWLAEVWGVPFDWLPSIAAPTEVVGHITAEAATATGLGAGTPVLAGLVDATAASLEAGVASAGDVCEMTGQSTVLNAAVPYELLAGGIGALTAWAYPIPGLYLLAGTMVSTGGILRWFRDHFSSLSAVADVRDEKLREGLRSALAAEGDPFEVLDRLAASAPVGSHGLVLLPYFLGERSPIWDSNARGTIVGLSMATTRADVVRAILEGTAYGMNHNLEEMRRLGLDPPALRVVGGGAQSCTWNTIKADVTGLTVEVPAETRGAAVGSALVAAAGVKLLNDLGECVRHRYAARDRIEPDQARHLLYQRYYALYRALYPALVSTFQELAKLRRASP